MIKISYFGTSGFPILFSSTFSVSFFPRGTEE